MQRYRALRQLLGYARAGVTDAGRAPALMTTASNDAASVCAGAPPAPSRRRMPRLRDPPQQADSVLHACRALTTSAAAHLPRGGGGGGGGEEPGYEVTEAEADEAMHDISEAFQGLVGAAWALAQKGQPLEAEALLSEGIQSAEEILGADAVELAPLHDQLALLRFFHDRCEEAVAPARAAHALLVQLAAEGPGAAPVAALAAVRLAAVLLGSGAVPEAEALAEGAVEALEVALAEGKPEGLDPEKEEEAAERLSKFEAGLGEALFYRTLCALCAPGSGPAVVASAAPGLSEGFRMMAQQLGTTHPLTASALREHNRLVERAMGAEDLTLAEALYRQELGLHREFEPVSEHVAMLGYQLGTLQYVLGRYEEAAATLQGTIDLLRAHFEGGEKHLLTVRHRLGMVRGAGGEHAAARRELDAIAADLASVMGADNPVSHELNFMVALMALRELPEAWAAAAPEGAAAAVTGTAPTEAGGEAIEAGGEERRQRLLGELRSNLAALLEYGESHMLVKKARQEAEPWLPGSAPL